MTPDTIQCLIHSSKSYPRFYPRIQKLFQTLCTALKVIQGIIHTLSTYTNLYTCYPSFYLIPLKLSKAIYIPSAPIQSFKLATQHYLAPYALLSYPRNQQHLNMLPGTQPTSRNAIRILSPSLHTSNFYPKPYPSLIVARIRSLVQNNVADNYISKYNGADNYVYGR